MPIRKPRLRRLIHATLHLFSSPGPLHHNIHSVQVSEHTAPIMATTTDTEENRDDIVGLEIHGRVFYCHKTTLQSGFASGSYFANRFGGNIPPGGRLWINKDGISVYLLEGNVELFEKHILEYLLRGHPGRLVPFSQDPELWRALRREADYYGLQGLVELLHVTHTCAFEYNGSPGVLHWLGTGKGKHEYRNPHKSGAIYVGGYFDWSDLDRKKMMTDERSYNPSEEDLFNGMELSRVLVVDYRPPVMGLKGKLEDYFDDEVLVTSATERAYLEYGTVNPRPLDIDLKGIRLRPTHYTLRQNATSSDPQPQWNLEASENRSDWVVLHRVRGDSNAPVFQTDFYDKNAEIFRMADYLKGTEDASDFLLSSAETYFRRTWELKAPRAVSSVFYRHFRLIGTNDGNISVGTSECLFPVCGLELYGEVHEA